MTTSKQVVHVHAFESQMLVPYKKAYGKLYFKRDQILLVCHCTVVGQSSCIFIPTLLQKSFSPSNPEIKSVWQNECGAKPNHQLMYICCFQLHVCNCSRTAFKKEVHRDILGLKQESYNMADKLAIMIQQKWSSC